MPLDSSLTFTHRQGQWNVVKSFANDAKYHIIDYETVMDYEHHTMTENRCNFLIIQKTGCETECFIKTSQDVELSSFSDIKQTLVGMIAICLRE